MSFIIRTLCGVGRPLVGRLALVVAGLCAWASAQGQCSVRGTVVDGSDGQALPSASVVVYVGDAAKGWGATGEDGRFAIDSLAAGDYSLRISFVGYEPYAQKVSLSKTKTTADVGRLKLKPEGRKIEEVTVVSQVARQEQKGDTTVFNAGAYKVNPDATTEDLLRKMPGMEVKDGQVSHGGESVKKVLVDGKEFFGSDPSAALKNIDADMVDKIEVFDKQSEQAEFTGFADGKEEKTINILTKQGIQHGIFGRAAAGYGTDKHFEVDGTAHMFRGDQRLSVIGSVNDVDKQGFASPGGGGQAGENTNGSIGLNYSLEKDKKLRLESSYVFAYRDNNVSNSQVQEYFQSSDAEDSLHSYKSVSSSGSLSRAHRVTLRLRWQPGENDMLVFSPSFNYQNGSQSSTSSGIDTRGAMAYSQTSQVSQSGSSSWSLGTGLTWRHKLGAARRSISASLRASVQRSKSDGTSRGGMTDDDTYSGMGSDVPPVPNGDTAPPDTTDFPPSIPNEVPVEGFTAMIDTVRFIGQFSDARGRSSSFSARVVYTEPFGEHWGLAINYEPSYSLNTNDKRVLSDTVRTSASAPNVNFTSPTFSAALSNDMESRYLIHRAGLAVNAIYGRTFRATLGLDAQQSILKGDQTYPLEFSTRRTFFSLMPSFELSTRSEGGLNVRFKYRSQSSAPSISQLQDVVDVSDVRRYSAGNPSLKQSVSHRLNLNLAHSNRETSRSVFMMSNLSVTNGFVASSSVVATNDSVLPSGVILPAGTQLTMPVNLDGQVSASVNLTMSTPVSKWGCNASLSLGTNLQRTPGFYDSRKITNRNSSFSLGMSLGSAFSEVFDFNVSYNPSYNIVRSSGSAESNYDYYRHSVRADVNTLFFNRHLVLASSVVHNFSQGMGDGFDNNNVSWNAAVAYKFLARRQAELRLRVNDILNSNQSSSRSVQDAYVQTSSSNVLQRYAMLTFTYKFNEMSGRGGNRRGGDRRGGGGMPPDGPPMGGGPGGGMGGPPM